MSKTTQEETTQIEMIDVGTSTSPGAAPIPTNGTLMSSHPLKEIHLTMSEASLEMAPTPPSSGALALAAILGDSPASMERTYREYMRTQLQHSSVSLEDESGESLPIAIPFDVENAKETAGIAILIFIGVWYSFIWLVYLYTYFAKLFGDL